MAPRMAKAARTSCGPRLRISRLCPGAGGSRTLPGLMNRYGTTNSSILVTQSPPRLSLVHSLSVRRAS